MQFSCGGVTWRKVERRPSGVGCCCVMWRHCIVTLSVVMFRCGYAMLGHVEVLYSEGVVMPSDVTAELSGVQSSGGFVWPCKVKCTV